MTFPTFPTFPTVPTGSYLTAGVLLAEEPNRGPDYGKASPVGLLVVALLLVAVFFLVRSMNRQLKKVPASFDSAAESSAPVTPAPAGAAGLAQADPGPDDAAADDAAADDAAADDAAADDADREAPPRANGG